MRGGMNLTLYMLLLLLLLSIDELTQSGLFLLTLILDNRRSWLLCIYSSISLFFPSNINGTHQARRPLPATSWFTDIVHKNIQSHCFLQHIRSQSRSSVYWGRPRTTNPALLLSDDQEVSLLHQALYVSMCVAGGVHGCTRLAEGRRDNAHHKGGRESIYPYLYVYIHTYLHAYTIGSICR